MKSGTPPAHGKVEGIRGASQAAQFSAKLSMLLVKLAQPSTGGTAMQQIADWLR